MSEITRRYALFKAVLTFTVWVSGHLILNSAPARMDRPGSGSYAAGLTPDKIRRFISETDPDTDISLKWNRFAIFDPKTALEAQEKQKTPNTRKESAAIQAITQAPEFLRLKQEEEARKDPKQKARDDDARQKARLAIEKPFEAAKDAEKTKDAATKRREQIAAEAILNPREFNAKVDRLKTPELKAREAEVWRAFTQPKEFLEERTRLKKQDGPAAQASGRAKRQNQENSGNNSANGKGRLMIAVDISLLSLTSRHKAILTPVRFGAGVD